MGKKPKRSSKSLIVSSLILIILMMAASCAIFKKTDREGINVLVLVPRYYGANFFLLQDVIEEYGWHITLTEGGDIILVGHTDSAGAGSFDVCLIKVENKCPADYSAENY